MVINVADSFFYMASIWMLSGSENAVGYTSIAITLFMLPELLTFLVGPLVDQINPKKILLSSSILQIIIQLLVILSLLQSQEILLLILIFFSALLSNITYPIEEVMIPKLVEQSKIVLANSIFSFSYQTLDIIVNSLSAFLLIWISFKNMYLLALAFFVAAALILIRFKFPSSNENENYRLSEYFTDVKAGANYFFKHEVILKLSIPLVMLNLFMAVNAVALPFFVRSFDHSLSLLAGMTLAMGLGKLLSNFLTHVMSQLVDAGKLLAFFLALDGAFRLAGILSGRVELIYLFFFLASLFSGIYNTIFASLYQMIPKQEYIGRVGTFVDSFIAAAMPIGGVLGGFMVQIFGAQGSLLFNPILSVLAGLYYLFDHVIARLPKVNSVVREKE
jgi:MFS family permease